jgi:hypothetical protein
MVEGEPLSNFEDPIIEVILLILGHWEDLSAY